VGSRRARAAEGDIIRIGVVGCGSRGPDAARNAMNVDPGVRLVAMADLFEDRVKGKRDALKQVKPEQVIVDDDHCFVGLDAYRHVIESVDVVLIANAAKFHPLHMRAAIEAGKHVFVEKPHAIDPVGVREVSAACELAKQKGLCVVSGLQSRYDPGYREAMQRVHDGVIGDIVAIEEKFLRTPYRVIDRPPGLSEIEWQYSTQYHFSWLSGDDVPQSLIHNLDRTTWALREETPVRAHGLGGRSSSFDQKYGNVFDHHAVIYEYASGVRVYAFCRTQERCYNQTISIILGTKGRCYPMQSRIEGETNWRYEGPKPSAYDEEHRALFSAIRSGEPVNNGDYMARSTLVTIMGQITCYTGKEVTWEQVEKSDFYFAPRPEECSFDMEPPVRPDANGVYPVPVPGVTEMV
jgi:predicted dehydrogenase